jgi:hypothetical protein
MLYRSPWTRWVLAASAVSAGAMLTFGNGAKWRSAPSLQWLAQAPIPLQAWGVAVMVYGVLLLPVRTRPVAYAAGAVLWATFTISIVATIGTTGPKSALGIAAFIDVTAFHLLAIRTAWGTRYAP